MNGRESCGADPSCVHGHNRCCGRGRRANHPFDRGGAAEKAVMLLTNERRLGSLLWVSQEGGHEVKIAGKDQLVAQASIDEPWERLYNNLPVLIPQRIGDLIL